MAHVGAAQRALVGMHGQVVDMLPITLSGKPVFPLTCKPV